MIKAVFCFSLLKLLPQRALLQSQDSKLLNHRISINASIANVDRLFYNFCHESATPLCLATFSSRVPFPYHLPVYRNSFCCFSLIFLLSHGLLIVLHRLTLLCTLFLRVSNAFGFTVTLLHKPAFLLLP